MARLTIGQVSEKAGLASSAIRYYEHEGLIPKAPKEGGRRVYEAEIFFEQQIADRSRSDY